jgi:hypothetical protein
MEVEMSTYKGAKSFSCYPYTKEKNEHTLHRQRRYSKENIHCIDREDIPQRAYIVHIEKELYKK